MPFSLTSYLLGVGTIAGAIAFGVGTGVLMSKSALKDTPAQTRVERVARVEPVAAALAEPAPAAAPPVAEAKENPAPPIAAAVAAPSHQPDPAPSAQPETPKAPPETSKTEARTDAGEKPPEAVKQGAPANPSEPKLTAQETRPAVRRVERPRHYAERRTRRVPVETTRQWQSDEQDPPERPEVVYRREEPRFGLLRVVRPPAFDRSDDRDDDR